MRAAVLVCLALAGCAPVPLAVAEQQCFRAQSRGSGGDTRLAIGIGAGDWGGSGVSLSTAVPLGASGSAADPELGYATCVLRRTGQPPVTPYRAWLGLN